jgi:hypothetical protein
MNRWFCLLLSLASPAWGQLELFSVNGTEERPLSGLLNLGSTPTGEPLDVLVRVRNPGPAAATLSALSVAGAGFRLHQDPPIPFVLPARFSLDFYVRFAAEQPAADARGVLRINTVTITLLAAAVASANLYLLEDDGSRLRRMSGQPIAFAPLERGGLSRRRLLIENPHAFALTISALSAEGDSFRLDAAPPLPLALGARQTQTFEIVFQPATSGLKQGRLIMERLRFPLEGSAREPALPRPQIVLPPEASQSGKQARISIRFDSVSRADGAGLLRVEFQPAVAGPDDVAILFPSTNRRSVAFQVRTGESQALFNSQREIVVQTGTTAGSLRFVAEMGGFTAESRATIAPAPVAVDTVTASRGLDILDVTIKGFDNTRSATEVAFTFFDANGVWIDPGEIRANVTEAFRRYFENAPAGGLFSLRAVFPATGFTTPIMEMELEFRNQAGVERTPRIRF